MYIYMTVHTKYKHVSASARSTLCYPALRVSDVCVSDLDLASLLPRDMPRTTSAEHDHVPAECTDSAWHADHAARPVGTDPVGQHDASSPAEGHHHSRGDDCCSSSGQATCASHPGRR